MSTYRSGFKSMLGLMASALLAGCIGNDDCGDPAERPWCDTTMTPQERTTLLLDEMTLDEKLSLMAGDNLISALTGLPAAGVSDGIPRLGLNPVYYSDGPLGVREGRATAHASPLAIASSFNPDLAREVGKAIGNEVKNKGNDVAHAPTLDVVRIYTSGRVFETFGEDPYLVSQMGLQWMQGLESEGVIANAKHFGVYTQEGLIGVPYLPLSGVIGSRFLYNAVIDERAMREIYLSPFEVLVKQGGLDSIMCSYNYVNDESACGSKRLLHDILRDEWGFEGYVLTDYVFAQKDTVDAANSGNDLEMPIGIFYTESKLKGALEENGVTEQTIDQRVGNVLRTLFDHGVIDRKNYPANEEAIDIEAHALVAQSTAEQGSVLLKNDNLLPVDLGKITSLAIIGDSSDRFINGGGSSMVMPYELLTPRTVITERAEAAGVTVYYHDGGDLAAAAETASSADIALVFAATSSSEGQDRTCHRLTCLEEKIVGRDPEGLINAVAAVNSNTTVILETGSAVLTPWRHDVAALLQAWFPGQYGGPALANIIFGDVNPSGKLPLTFPESAGDTLYANNFSRFPGNFKKGPKGSLFEVEYDEGVMVGYRWFDDQDIPVAYPFGFGLSYTSFSYSDLTISGSLPNLNISVKITNTGDRTGSETAQLYVGLPNPSDSERQPPRQLKSFDKVTLAPGQSATAEFSLDTRSLSYWNEASENWQMAKGCYRLFVGAHSRDLAMQASLPFDGGTCE
ncbi:MAG: glycoside hydrolase family 3 C-terminal domain-containing protein [Pseudomonadales bacterium]|nr:glycoside hydrolase family 3 C-terminal domain-containing protein [Pseudomonadales bacterium]